MKLRHFYEHYRPVVGNHCSPWFSLQFFSRQLMIAPIALLAFYLSCCVVEICKYLPPPELHGTNDDGANGAGSEVVQKGTEQEFAARWVHGEA
jgi:hypothetical protein